MDKIIAEVVLVSICWVMVVAGVVFFSFGIFENDPGRKSKYYLEGASWLVVGSSILVVLKLVGG